MTFNADLNQDEHKRGKPGIFREFFEPGILLENSVNFVQYTEKFKKKKQHKNALKYAPDPAEGAYCSLADYHYCAHFLLQLPVKK